MNWNQKASELLAEKLGYEHFTPGLIRLNHWIAKYNLYPKNSKVITICGTNGKGETTHCMGHLLHNHLKSYCQWTSPHILELSERFVSANKQIDSKLLFELIEKWIPKLAENETYPLSYYEFLFIVFLDWCSQINPEFILCEVGLGGRLDGVNSLDASLVLLTSISRDHQEFLGNRYSSILSEKLGVLRSKSILISSIGLDYLNQNIEKKVWAMDVDWINLSNNSDKRDFSTQNKALCARAFELICHTRACASAMESFKYSNRKSIEINNTKIDLVGSHNPDGLRKLVHFLAQHHYNKYDAVLVSFSKRSDKDLETMTQTSLLLGEDLWVTGFGHQKAVEFEKLRQLLENKTKGRLNFVSTYKEFFETSAFGHQRILVTGSYYFIGEVYSHLQSILSRQR